MGNKYVQKGKQSLIVPFFRRIVRPAFNKYRHSHSSSSGCIFGEQSGELVSYLMTVCDELPECR